VGRRNACPLGRLCWAGMRQPADTCTHTVPQVRRIGASGLNASRTHPPCDHSRRAAAPHAGNVPQIRLYTPSDRGPPPVGHGAPPARRNRRPRTEARTRDWPRPPNRCLLRRGAPTNHQRFSPGRRIRFITGRQLASNRLSWARPPSSHRCAPPTRCPSKVKLDHRIALSCWARSARFDK